jgi:hypothetical protein
MGHMFTVQSRILLPVMKYGNIKRCLVGIGLLAVAAILFVWFMLPYYLPQPEPPGPECEFEVVYADKAECSCPLTSEWVEELGGWLCIPINNLRLDCEDRGPYWSVTDCSCRPPKVWIEGETDPLWNCEVW